MSIFLSNMSHSQLRRGGLKLWGMLATPSFTGGYPQINPFGVETLGDTCDPQFHWGLSTDQPLRG